MTYKMEGTAMNRWLLLVIILFLSLVLFACSDSIETDDIDQYSSDTLADGPISFSLDSGFSFKTIDQRLEVFDIWNEVKYEQGLNIVFFYAFTYEEFLNKVEQAKNPSFYTYDYPDLLEFNNFIQIYNEAYFEENILIFYYKFESSLSENYIYTAIAEGDTLTVNVNRFESMMTAITSYLGIITIKKADIFGIEKIELVIRTVAPLQSLVKFYIKNDYMRDFYLNDMTLEDFSDLDNLKDIRIFKWSISVFLDFANPISDEELNEIVAYLESSPHIKVIARIGKDFITVKLKDEFYDKALNRTLIISDFIDDEDIINDYGLLMRMNNFTPIGFIEFYLVNEGKDYATQMQKDIKEGDYPFLIIE